MKPKVAIVGNGNVGTAIKTGLERSGYEVRSVGNEPALVREVAAWGDLVILAVPFPAIDEAIRSIGTALNNKTLVDVTNALTPDYKLALGFTTSGAEELQKRCRHRKS